MLNLNVDIYNYFGARIGSGSEFEEDEAGWDLPLIQLENDLQPSSRYRVKICRKLSLGFLQLEKRKLVVIIYKIIFLILQIILFSIEKSQREQKISYNPKTCINHYTHGPNIICKYSSMVKFLISRIN